MVTSPSSKKLPPQLSGLAAKAPDLPNALRQALQISLSGARHDTTPEQVLSDTFARLGYLPEEAKRMSRKLLSEPPQGTV